MKIVGVRFKIAGKIYFFDPGENHVARGDKLVVETSRGLELGTAVSDIQDLPEEQIPHALKPIVRLATPEDVERAEANRRREKEAMAMCRQKIADHGLKMKLIDAECTFDNSKLLFYFTADGRVDFRELVKDLAGLFRTRIELRQVGVRDETKMIGGIGMCGRPLCCHKHLSNFLPVSIKMAKEQNLSLNPGKISGVCGRLMCCLTHEQETYEELNKTLPPIGALARDAQGVEGEVIHVNVLRQRVKVKVDTGENREVREYEASQLEFVGRGRRPRREENPAGLEELSRLEQLERQERQEQGGEARPPRREKPARQNRHQTGAEKPWAGGEARSGRGQKESAQGRPAGGHRQFGGGKNGGQQGGQGRSWSDKAAGRDRKRAFEGKDGHYGN